MMLKPHVPQEHENLLHRGLNKFNDALERFSDWYGYQLARLAKHLWITVAALLAFALVSAGVFRVLPSAFVPPEDNGYYMVAVNLPEGATLSRTIAVLDKVQGFMSEDPDIVDKAGIAGFDILASAQKFKRRFDVCYLIRLEPT